jgi:pyrimidine operon attenuation protein/uracil phosphoribosyltransferase
MGALMADLLDEAAAILEHDGWCQADLHNDLGQHCAAGAITLAAFRADLDHRGVYEQLTHDGIRALEVSLGGRVPVVDWNDTPGRTVQEVLDALRAAAKSERGKAE